ncbi:hypothetical protein ACXZ9C_10855 [Streptococcus agalactiae]
MRGCVGSSRSGVVARRRGVGVSVVSVSGWSSHRGWCRCVGCVA